MGQKVSAKWGGLVAVMGLALAISTGCQGGPTSRGNDPPRPAGSGGAGGPRINRPPAPVDAVGVSELRERALKFLGETSLSTDAEVRANTIEALLPVPARLEAVARRGLSDENLGVRAVAAAAAGKTKLPRLAEHVRPLLRDQSAQVRVNAIYALARLGQPVDLGPLGAAMNDPSPFVRAQAGWVLGELGNKSALPLIRDTARDRMSLADVAQIRSMRLQLAEAMIKLGDETAIDEIRAALFPSRPEELESTALAAQILGEVGDKQSAGQLIQLTAFKDPAGNRFPAEIRMVAAASLARLGQPYGSFIADEFYNHSSAPLRAQAALTYGDIRRRENLGLLDAMMKDPQPLVGVAAAAAILRTTDGYGKVK